MKVEDEAKLGENSKNIFEDYLNSADTDSSLGAYNKYDDTIYKRLHVSCS